MELDLNPGRWHCDLMRSLVYYSATL